MKNTVSSHFILKAFPILSILISLIMVFTLFPQRALAQENRIMQPTTNVRPAPPASESMGLSVNTGTATEITDTSAMLNGTITGMSDGVTVQVFFEYGADISYGNTTEKLDMATNGDFFIRLADLTADTTYHFHVAATGPSIDIYGDDATFTTAMTSTSAASTSGITTSNTTTTNPTNITSTDTTTTSISPSTTTTIGDQPPVLDANLAATNITESSATLNGTLTSLGSAAEVDVCFEYGPDTNYGSTTDIQQLTVAIPFSADIKNLTPGTTYHYRIDAKSSVGEVYSEDSTFTTIPNQSDNSNGPVVQSNITSAHVDPAQETKIVSNDKKIKVAFPVQAVNAPVDVEIIERGYEKTTGMQIINEFELDATDSATKAAVSRFNKDLQITIQNTPAELAGLDIGSVRLFYLDEKSKQWLPAKSSRYDTATNVLTASTDHFTNFGEIGNSLAVGPGRVMASQVNLYSGAATYSYPFELPPGPGGFQPKLELTYNSGVVDAMKNKQAVGSWVGLGWTLDLGRISLNINTHLYYLELNGSSYQLVSSDGVNYKTNPDQFYKITRSGNTWTLYDRDGNLFTFGGTSDSQQYYFQNAHANKLYDRWNLSFMQDTHGNQVAVTYSQEKIGTSPNDTVRSAYPLTLKYDNNLIEVDFANAYDISTADGYLRYDDPQTDGSNSAPNIMETRKLTSIAVKVSGNLIRKYNFAYNETNATTSTDYGGIYYAGTLTLASITQVGVDGTSTLPTTSFSYQNLQTYRQGSQSNYTGNPGNPASFSWPHLTVVNSGYGGSVSFAYTQIPGTSANNIWTREAVTTKTITPGIGTNQVVTYTYTGNPQYLGPEWDQEYRGFGQVRETDAAGNYINHFFYTTGIINNTDADKLTGKEYDTKWFNSSGVLLREKTYNWSAISVGQTYVFTFVRDHWDYGYGTFYGPCGLSVDSQGTIYVADEGNDIVELLGKDGSDQEVDGNNGDFYSPGDVAVDNQGNIYVADTGNDRIQKFNPPYYFLLQWGGSGSGNGYFYNPCGIAVDNQGHIYVADSGNNIIQKFDSSGNFLLQWGGSGSGNGKFNDPESVAVDNQGYVYVADTGNARIQKFDTSGNFILQWGGSGSGNGKFNSPEGVAVDNQGYVYVADTYNGRIQKFDSSGNFITQVSFGYDNPYEDGSQFENPMGVAVDNQGYVYVADTYNDRIQCGTNNWVVELNQIDDITGTKTSQTRYSYDSYGNIITEYQDGDISTSSDDATVWRVFNPNTTANILDKPARERTYATCMTQDSGGDNLKKEIDCNYDSQANSSAPIKGNLTSQVQWIDASNSITSNFAYDTYGNKLTEQDPNGNTTTWTYDTTYYTYPVTKTYPITGLTESYTYDPGTSNLLTQTDVNGQVTTYTYDTFKRLISVDKPLGQNPDIQYQYNSWGTIGSQNIKTITWIDATHSLWSADYFDGLGRVVQTQTNGESGHTIVSSTTAYNNCGQVANQYVSQDYASILTSYQTPTWNSTSYTYDGLGRVLVQTNPDSTTISNNYSNAWENTVTDALGHKKNYYYDAFQRMIKVEELDASQQIYATTNYSYYVLGNLTQVVDNAGNTTTMSYDWLSRKTAMTDPDMGSWSYGYDSNGNLTSQTDAKSQTITMTYDALNRLTGKSGTGFSASYTYDAYVSGSNYGKGKRTGMTDAAGTTGYKYDARGRQTEEKRTVDSVDYTTSFAYDGADRNTTITYPTGEVVTQAYNGRGLPNTLSGNTAGSLVTGTTYNALGLITQITLGNTLITTYGYYGTGGTYDTTGGYYGRLWEIKTLPQAGGTALQDVQHTWDAAGNLSTRQDVLAGETENFTYDSLDRLTAVSGPYTQSYTYNQIGNITSMNGSSYTYGTQPQAVTTMGSNSYAYDANGNLTLRTEGVVDRVNGLTLTSGGSGYTSAPTVSITGGGGSGAAASAALAATLVGSLTLTSGGSNYTSVPTVNIIGGGGSGATATAILVSTSVASIIVTNGGSGYTSVPTVSITGGGGSGAAASATLAPTSVGGLTLTSGGSNYTSVPTVNITGGGGSGATASATLTPTSVASLTRTNGGSGYTSAPAVSFSGGGGSGAAATATLTPTSVANLNLTNGGSNYTSAPTVNISGGGGSGATGTAILATRSVSKINVTNQGSGYTSTPTVTISGGGGTGATATATVSNQHVTAITVTNGGSGYTSVPTVTITGGGGSGAQATAVLSKASVASLTLTNGGSGYTSAPSVSFSGGGGSGAAATATLTPTSVASLNRTNGGSGYTSVPSVSFSGGGGSGAAATANLTSTSLASLTITNSGSGYTSIPTVSFSGGGGSGAAATASLAPRSVASVTITNGGSGYTSTPAVSFSGGGGSGAVATSTLAPTTVSGLTLTNAGSGYTSAPTVSFSGGGGSGAAAIANLPPVRVVSISVTNGGSGYTSAPTVSFSGGGGSGTTATAILVSTSVVAIIVNNGGSGYTSAPTVTINGGGGSGATATAIIIPTTQTITWDVENRVIATSDGASFSYDGDGNRIEKTEGGQTILYVNKYYELNITASVATSNYYLGDRLIAEMQGTTLTYVHQDALTGTSLTTDNTGTSTGTIKYLPFGVCRNSQGSLPAQLFTGQRLDSTGLYYYGARYYDPTIGRFISPDTIVPDPSNPQSLNRYTYCSNNPTSRLDPDGHYDWYEWDMALWEMSQSSGGSTNSSGATINGTTYSWVYGSNMTTTPSLPASSSSGVTTNSPQSAPPGGTTGSTSAANVVVLGGIAAGTAEDSGISAAVGGIISSVLGWFSVGGMIFSLVLLQGDAPNVVMSDASKQKAVESLGEQIKEHEQNIKDNPGSQSQGHWEQEIDTFKESIGKILDKMGPKARQEAEQYLEEQGIEIDEK